MKTVFPRFLLICLIMLISPFRTFAIDKSSDYMPQWVIDLNITYDSDRWPDKNKDFRFTSGDGSESSPYLINSADAFGGLMYYSQLDDDEREKREKYMGSSGHSVYYKLTADIDMKGKRCTTIGDLLKQCKAYINFDGDGHTIKNVVMPYDGKSYSYNGIFGLLFDSEIKNVTFENYFIGSEGDRLGLVGFMHNSSLDNVHVINGMVAGCDYIGGLVGGAGWNENKFISSPGSTCYIVNCSFEGEVHNRNSKDDAYFGGLVGYMKGVKMYIMSSLFRGCLSASNAKYFGRGGLVGCLEEDTDVYIDACMIMGNPGYSSGSYNCPLEEDYESLASSKNGWAVANVSSSSSKVHLMSPIYICKNRGYSKDNGKVQVACAGSYGSKSNNVFYYNAKGSAYTGISDGGASKIVTITDGYADSYTANYGNEGYIYNQYKHYYSVATNGKIIIDKEKPTCVYNVSSDLLLKEVKGPGNQNITLSSNTITNPTCIYLQNGETINLKVYKQSINGSSIETKGYYPSKVTIDGSPMSQWSLTDGSFDGQYYNIEITPNSTNLRNDVNVVSEMKPYATNLSVDFNCYDRKAIIYITKATDSSIGAYYDIYRDNDYIGTVYSPNYEPTASYTDTTIPIDNKEREVKYDVYYVDSNNDADKVLDATIPWKTRIDNLGNSVSCISVMKNELKLSASTEGVSGYNLKLHLSYPDVGLYDGADYKVYVKGTNTPIATGKFSKNDKLLSDNRRQVEVAAGVDDMCNTYEFFFNVTPNVSNAAAQESPHASGKASGKNLISKLMASKGDNKGYAAININAKKISAGDQLKFTIERKLATEPDDKFTLIGTINSMDAAISYTDDKVTPGNIYRYRVSVYSGCADASTGNIVFNESPDHEIEDYGFCQTKGSVSGRITYNGNNAVENVAVYITSNESESGTKQYTSAFFQGKRCDVNNDSVQGITFDNIKDLDDMYPYTLQFFMMPENLASRITNYGINVASVPQVVLAIIPPDGESLVGKYRIAPLWKADGDYIDDAAGDGAECYTEGITGNLAMNKFTNVFLQRMNESDFRIGVLDVVDGNDVIVWSSPFSTAGNVDKMEQAYRGKLTFARPAGDEYASYRGWIDDIRLWKGEMSDKALLKYASNILSGTEKNLELYVNFDENLPDYCFDMSSTSNIRNGHHAATYAMQCSYNVPKQEQLGLKGITDENGNYIISGIPFTGEGTLYNVVPVYGTHTFNPTNQQLYISESSLVVNKTDFSDVSSFPVKVRATYYGTMLPVAGANIKIDDVTQVYDGKIMETDEQGYAEVQVPIGRHKMKLEMINHTFAAGGTACDADTLRMLDAEGKGYIDVPNGLDLDQELTFIDATTVRLIGRAVGGEKEAAKGYNCGLSKNNIGRVQIQLKPTLSGNYSMHNGVFDGDSHEVGNGNKSVNSTTVYGRDFITITTDPATGEYDALVPPIEFYTSSIYTVNGDNQGDYMKLTTDDFGGAVTISPNLGVLSTDSTYIEDKEAYYKYTYNTLTDFIHYSSPKISLTSDNEAYPNMFGESEYEYNDAQDNTKSDIIQLWSRDTEKWEKGGSDAYELGYPVFKMASRYKMNIEAYEMYFNRDYTAEERGEASEYRLPLDALEFSITNQMATLSGTVGSEGTVMLQASDASVDKVTLGADGKAVYSFQAGFPNYSGDYTLPMSMQTEIHGQTLTYPPSGETFKGIVLGQNDVPGSNFVTAGPDMVDFVLRDPPGSNSYATIEAGSTISATHSSSTTGNGTESDYVEISIGPKNSTSTGDGSIYVHYEAVDINMTDIGLTMSWDVEDLDTWTVSYSFDRAISTSSSSDYVGADGDIFIGSSTNLNIAEAKKLGFVIASPSDEGAIVSDNNVNYKLDISDCLSAGVSYETAFAYTQKHIRESLIPMIYDLRRQLIPNENIVNDFNGLPENKTNKPK